MNSSSMRYCPVCGEKLKIKKMACPGCQAEFPVNRELSAYEQLSDENAFFLKTFLMCRGNMKEVQERLKMSYPTVGCVGFKRGTENNNGGHYGNAKVYGWHQHKSIGHHSK